jgi:hypothetical protein
MLNAKERKLNFVAKFTLLLGPAFKPPTKAKDDHLILNIFSFFQVLISFYP